MRLLFTNHQLTHYTGTELFVREITAALKNRGHEVAAFSTRLGKVADEIRAADIPVVDDPTSIPVTPDLIHGQHYLESLAALLAFPETPALFHCHSNGRWQEVPLQHPRVVRYAVITNRFIPWFKEDFGIPAEKIDVVPNAVDLSRFKTIRTPAPSPEKALLFTSTIGEGPVLETLKQACAQCDLPLDLAGHSLGIPVDHPEELLPQYDLVFAAGRTAIEAMACGCAVIPIAVDKSGRLICPRTFATSQKVNFSSRKQYPPIREELIVRQIKRYRPEDAAAVTQRVRSEFGIDTACDRLESLYQNVVAEYPGPPPPEEERTATINDLLSLAQRAHTLSLDLDGIPPETQDLTRALQHANEQIAKLKSGWEITKSKRVQSHAALTTAKQKLEATRQLLEKSPLTRPAWKKLRQKWNEIDP